MTTIDQIVNVTISRQTTAVSRAAFNVPLFLATHTAFSDRAKEYASLTEVAGDFASTTNTYIAASKLFGQDIKPPKILVGRRQVNEVTVSVGTLANSTAYTLTVDGTAVTYTSDSSATANEIIAGLNSAFTAASISGITFTNNNNGTAAVNVVTAGTAWSLKGTSNLTLTNTTPSETYANAIDAIQQVNTTWYALICESHLDADILAIAAAIQAQKKVYFTSTSSAATKTSATTDIISQLKDAGYTRTSIQYSADAANYPEASWVGGQLPKTPGSNTWKFKQLIGNTVDILSSTESTYLKNKNGNRYEEVGGVNIMEEGVVASGEFIDVINKAA